MKVKWIGHSCFLLTAASGSTLLTDPFDAEHYKDSLGYAPIEETTDIVTVSHGHKDHSHIESVGGTPLVISSTTAHNFAGFNVHGVASFHDTQMGAQRGDNVIFTVRADGVSICHLGDLGDTLSAEQVEAIGDVDVLLIPVGGNFTIDAAAATRVWQQLSPPVTIPMHYCNDKCRFAIDKVDRFLAGKPSVEQAETSEIIVAKESLPSIPKIIVLEPAN